MRHPLRFARGMFFCLWMSRFPEHSCVFRIFIRFVGGQMDLWAVKRDLWTVSDIYGRSNRFVGVQRNLQSLRKICSRSKKFAIAQPDLQSQEAISIPAYDAEQAFIPLKERYLRRKPQSPLSHLWYYYKKAHTLEGALHHDPISQSRYPEAALSAK